MKAHILADVRFRPPEAGGRPVMPLGSGYAPHLRLDGAREAVAVRVNDVPADACFGQAITVRIELSYPQVDYGALTPGVRFELLEGPKVVAEGRCTASATGPEA